MKKASRFFFFTLFMVSGILRAKEIIKARFDGPSIKEGKTYHVAVYLPAGYSDSEDPYPWYIFLHGAVEPAKQRR